MMMDGGYMKSSLIIYFSRDDEWMRAFPATAMGQVSGRRQLQVCKVTITLSLHYVVRNAMTSWTKISQLFSIATSGITGTVFIVTRR
jgi:hypothetical protein